MLSFFSIFGIQNNKMQLLDGLSTVVNCFHFSVSLGYKTTILLMVGFGLVLWIAFIFQYLWDTKQQTESVYGCESGCELLSFFSIFGIQNNPNLNHRRANNVVNCFHFSVSLGYKTTPVINPATKKTLWIAFIFQYLWDTKQQDLDKS